MAFAGLAPDVFAGTQLEEPLTDAVRSALSAALRSDPPPTPEFAQPSDALRYQRWLEDMHPRLSKKFPQPRGEKSFCKPFGMKANALAWMWPWFWGSSKWKAIFENLP
jgi:hypothetical protein